MGTKKRWFTIFVGLLCIGPGTSGAREGLLSFAFDKTDLNVRYVTSKKIRDFDTAREYAFWTTSSLLNNEADEMVFVQISRLVTPDYYFKPQSKSRAKKRAKQLNELIRKNEYAYQKAGKTRSGRSLIYYTLFRSGNSAACLFAIYNTNIEGHQSRSAAEGNAYAEGFYCKNGKDEMSEQDVLAFVQRISFKP